MFAIVSCGYITSWFKTLDEALDNAYVNLGVEFIEKIGIGIVWCKISSINL